LDERIWAAYGYPEIEEGADTEPKYITVYNLEGEYRKLQHIPYKNIDELKSENPDCCEARLFPDRFFSNGEYYSSNRPLIIKIIRKIYSLYWYVFEQEGIDIHMSYGESFIHKNKILKAPVVKQEIISECGINKSYKDGGLASIYKQEPVDIQFEDEGNDNKN
jgi:hypothetical protein